MTDDASLVERYSKLSTCFVYDVLSIGGFPHQMVHRDVQRMITDRTIAGVAFCVKGETIYSEHQKKHDKNLFWEMLGYDTTGMIVVIEGGADDVVLGDNFVHGLKVKGCTGVVANGGIRDRDELHKIAVPIYGRFASAVSASKWEMTDLQVPVTLEGQTSTRVTVNPGDIILADGDGVVVVPRHLAEQVLEDAEQLGVLEEKRRDGLNSGRDPVEVFREVPLFGHIRPLMQKA